MRWTSENLADRMLCRSAASYLARTGGDTDIGKRRRD
jgi:hypothetical protein